MGQIPLTLRRWQRAEYDRLVDLGVFEGEPLELLAGHLVVAEPKGAYHYSTITKIEYALRAMLPPGWLVRTQAPVWLDDESEPEPDLVVVPGAPDDYRDAHPSRPPLLIEVADSSLGLRSPAKGQPLRSGRDRGLLDREPRRPCRGGVSGSSARRLGRAWLEL